MNYSTIIETPEGSRMWGDVEVGQQVFGGDGSPTTVMARHEQGVVPIYKVAFDDGSYALCGLEHLWSVRGRTERRKGLSWQALTTGEIIQLGVTRPNGISRARQWEIPIQGPAQFVERQVPLNPYFVGIWLGDGTRGLPRFSKPYLEIVKRLRELGLDVHSDTNLKGHAVRGISHLMHDGTFALKSPERFIPDQYKYNSVGKRRELLRGLLDSDGEANTAGSISFSSTSERLLKDVLWLARSLGAKGMLAETVKQTSYKSPTGEKIECKPCYRATINMDWNPFTVEHKRAAWKPSEARYQKRWIESIEYSHDEDAMCISVDHPDGLYLANDFIVTHNTFTVAGLVPYELLAHKEKIVLTVAPTLRQVKLMWNEIETAIASIPAKLPERTTTGWQFAANRYAQGFSSSKGVNAQGFHGKDVLIIADEAIGIAPDLWDAIEGIRAAGSVRLVKLCNPTVPSGAPYEDFTRLRGSTECITISAFDTPNLQGLTLEQLLQLPDEELDYAPFPWLTRRRWVKEMYYKWGPTNPRFLSRVLGEFPTQADDSVFELRWIEAAAKPYDDELFARDCKRMFDMNRGFIQVGLDIAGPGEDETSMTARLGPYIIGFEAWSKADPLEEVLKALGNLQTKFPNLPIVILADIVGIGFHFARAIARQQFDVREFKAGDPPLDPRQFRNAKAQAYFRLRELLREGQVFGITDEDTKAQLSDIRYRELVNGTVEIEHKDEARARGSSSPDRAESLIMAFAQLAPKQTTVVFGQPTF